MRSRLPHTLGAAVPLWVGVLLAAGCSEAGAATTLGPLATSAGLFAALATLLLIQGWPAHVPVIALSGAGCVLLLAVAAAWLWRARTTQRVMGFSGSALALPLAEAPALPAPAARRAPFVPPAGLDAAPLLAELRFQFVQLQDAWDRADTCALRRLTTPEMLAELCFEWPGGATARLPNRTDVVTLHAELLGFEELAGTHLVSVEFSGLIREGAEQGAVPFRELWMLAKSKHDASGWKLARHQALL